MYQAEILTNFSYMYVQVVGSLILVIQGATMFCDLVVSVNFWSSLQTTGRPLISNPVSIQSNLMPKMKNLPLLGGSANKKCNVPLLIFGKSSSITFRK